MGGLAEVEASERRNSAPTVHYNAVQSQNSALGEKRREMKKGNKRRLERGGKKAREKINSRSYIPVLY